MVAPPEAEEEHRELAAQAEVQALGDPAQVERQTKVVTVATMAVVAVAAVSMAVAAAVEMMMAVPAAAAVLVSEIP